MVRLVLLVLALGACNTVFGLDEIDLGPEQTLVHGRYVVRELTNDANYMPMVTESVASTAALGLVAILDDGTESTVTYDEGTGELTFPVAREGQPYRLRTTFNGTTAELQHSAAELLTGTSSAGHIDRRPVQPTYVQFNYASATARTALVASTGIYTESDSGMATSTVTFDWRLAVPVTGGYAGMLDTSHNDVVYALEPEYGTGITAPAWTRFRAASSMSITQVVNVVATVPPPVAQPPNTCFHMTTTPDEETVRISSANPRDYFTSTGDWYAFAVPAPESTALAGGLYTAYSGFATPTNLDITPEILDPFPGTTLAIESGTAMGFYMQLPGAASTPQYNVTRVYALPERGTPPCAVSATSMSPTVGLPGGFTLAGVELDTDNNTVAIEAGSVPRLEWSIVSPGTVDLASVILYELTNVNGMTTLNPLWSAAVADTFAMLDPSMFVSGHTYALVVQTQRGRSNYRDGDFLAVTFPVEAAATWTHTFYVP